MRGPDTMWSNNNTDSLDIGTSDVDGSGSGRRLKASALLLAAQLLYLIVYS